MSQVLIPRNVCEPSVSDRLRDLKSRPFFVKPFLLACRTRNPKFVGNAVAGLQRLIVANALPEDVLGDVLDALRECSILALDIQLKVLQALPSLLQNYATRLSGPLLIAAFQVCFLLYGNKAAVVSNTAAATLQQLVNSTFDKSAVTQDAVSDNSPTSEVSIGNGTVSICGAILDAYRTLDDLCLLTEGQKPKYIQGASLTQNFGLELVASVIVSHVNTIIARPEQVHVLRIRLMPLIIRLLSEKPSFSTTVRAMRLVRLILSRLLIPLASECEAIMSLINHMLDPDAASPWKRALCLEVYRSLHADPLLMRTIYAQFDDGEEKRNVVRDHLGSLVRLASEKPAVIGLGHQSSVPFVATDDSSEQAALQAGGLVGSIGAAISTVDLDTPGISNRWSIIKTPCIEQTDKSEAPVLPATYIYSLALTCLTTFEEGLARFLMPFTVPTENKIKRKPTKTDREVDEYHAEGGRPQDGELSKAQSVRSRKVPVNPLTLREHPQYDHISTSAHMVDHCWPALLAASSTYLNATLDSENYHTLIRSFQKFTQTAGILGLSTPRDAFLTTLGKHALPSSSSPKSFKSAPTPNLNGLEFAETDNMTDGSQDASPALLAPSAKRQSDDLPAPAMNSRHLLCLRALLNLGIALGPVLQTSWTIIFETLQQADLLLTAASSTRQKQSSSQKRERMSVMIDQADDAEDLGLEIKAAETAALRLFESTSELTEEAFIDHLQCLCKLLRQEVPADQSPGTPDVTFSPTPGVRKHQKLRSVSGTAMESSASSHESAFVLEKMRDVVRSNIARLQQTDTVHSGWELIVTTLMDVLGSFEASPSILVDAANTLDGMLVLVAGYDGTNTQDALDNIRARSLSALLREITMLHQISGQPSRSSQQCELEIHRLALDALRAILEHCGDVLFRGWNDIFAIILSVCDKGSRREVKPSSSPAFRAQARSPSLVKSSFGSLQLICSDFMSSVPRSSLALLLDTLYYFSAQDHDLNISLTTSSFFETTSDYLLRDIVEVNLETTPPADALHQRLDELSTTYFAEASNDFLWLALLLQLVNLTSDTRVEVRHSVLHTIFRILDAKADQIPIASLLTLFRTVIKPLLIINREQHAHCHHPWQEDRPVSTTTWDDTAVIAIEGISQLSSQWLDTFGTNAVLSSMLSDLLDQYQTYLQRRLLAVSKAVFKGISKMLAEVEDHSCAGQLPIDLIWQMWVNNNPASHYGTNEKGLENNDAILAYLHCLGQLLRLTRGDLGVQQIKWTVGQLRESVSQATTSAYITDVDTMTSVQKAVLEAFKMIPIKAEGVDMLAVDMLSSFVAMACERDRRESKAQNSYIALSKASMGLLEDFMADRIRETAHDDPSLINRALSALDKPLHLKYKWRREGREPPPWRKATSAAVAMLHKATPIINKPSPADLSFWETTVSIVDGIIAVDCDACVDKARITIEEPIDIEAFCKVRDLIIRSLGSDSIPVSVRHRFSESLFRNSLIHEPHPDDLAWAGEDLLAGLNRDHFGRVKKLPPSPRSKMCYLLLDELFDLVAVGNKSPEQLRLAQAAGPYLILRAGLTLKTYILDQPLRGRMPQPRSQKNEMLYILKKLVELESISEAIPGAVNVTSRNKKHLQRLYPLILKALRSAIMDEVMTDTLRSVLEVIGSDMVM